MKHKLQTLARISLVRRGMRDLAAGAVAVADLRESECTSLRDDAASEIDSIHQSTHQRLQSTVDSGVLLFLEMERQSAARQLTDHENALALAMRDAEKRREVLLGKERALRTTDEIANRLRNRMSTRERRDDQKLGDDLSSARAGKPA